MRILCDIGHPAHIHLFKNVLFGLSRMGHEYLVTARDKDVTLELLEHYDIPYVSLGKHCGSVYGKAYGLPIIGYRLLRSGKEFNPDIIISHGSVYAALMSSILKRPHIALEDTGNMEQVMLYKPFTQVILTPSCLGKRFGNKQIGYEGYHELAYLHPSYFKPDPQIINKLKMNRGQKYVLFRFVSWRATHDVGQTRIQLKDKVRLVNELSNYAKVFVSAEGSLPRELQKYRIDIKATNFHDIMKYAWVVISEGAKVAAEAAIMGVPSIYINTEYASHIEELRNKYRLLLCFSNGINVVEKVLFLLQQNNLKSKWKQRVGILFREKIDVTKFLLWFVETYPLSAQIMRRNPDYHLTFKSSLDMSYS